MTDASSEVEKSGFAGMHKLWTKKQFEDRNLALEEALSNKVEVVRVSFVDQHGVLRGKTIAASALKSAFDSGITMTSTMLLKDTSHLTVFNVWDDDAGFGEGNMTGAGDVLMLPDPSTFKILPWSTHTGWVLADLYHASGEPVALSTRAILREAQGRLNGMGLEFIAGLEVEFHVFKKSDNQVSPNAMATPGNPPPTELITAGYQYLTENCYDQAEAVFDLIRRNAEGLGLPIRSLEIEFGPSQFEVTFDPRPALEQADNMIMFRSMVKQVCARHGLHATFMCRPKFKEALASGWHLHQSLIDIDTKENVFIPDAGEAISKTGLHWIAGILAHAEESCIFSTPTINGYKRYMPMSLAPDRIQWGQDNRGAMVRCLAKPGDKASRIENRIGEPAANPYLYITSQILSGMDGLMSQLDPPPAVSNRSTSVAKQLPSCLQDALNAFSSGEFYSQQIGKEFVTYYARLKQAEWDRFLHTITDWEEREYFTLF
ncbi:glutamine synthetase family protein [Saccharospirillum sp.]|uniref:glutamine synthetase family protein n=1 Tax=Saccharospirillum sp. TaxID=2033801 RepID=UPI0034A07493